MPRKVPLEIEFERVLSPFQRFIRDQTISAKFLLVCTLLALLIANSIWGFDYDSLLHTPAGLFLNQHQFELSIQHWINDALMSLFFFVIGLEIKREVLAGELSDPKKCMPVIASALGGMILPASIFALFNASHPTMMGWGIPMATDTAFAVGVLALLGKRAPTALAAFLTALAIIDDMGAIIVIALFYNDALSLIHLLWAGLALGGLVLCNILGIRRYWVYLSGGFLVWLAIMGSGVHATVAGILVAMAVPARAKLSSGSSIRRLLKLTSEFKALTSNKPDNNVLAVEEQHELLEQVKETAEKATTPLQSWVGTLNRPVALLVLPVFALANAGVVLEIENLPELLTDRLTLGIALGLVLGKTIGISSFCWLALRLGFGSLPNGLDMRHIIGVGLLGGVGFTMSIFIAGLGFGADAAALNTAKAGILMASMIAGVSGYFWLNSALPSSAQQAGQRPIRNGR